MKRGETIILLHGWCRGKNAQTVYEKTIRAFQKYGATVYTPNMPGFWGSATPKRALMLQDYADFLERFIQEHHIHAPILIGHSFGGRVAIKYIATMKNDVKALILSGTPGYSSVKKVKWLASLVLSKIGGIIFSLPGLSTWEEKIRGRFYYIVGARDFYRAEGEMRQTFKNIVVERLEGYMKKIRIPTLLVWGEEDVIVPVQIAEKMKATISGSELVIVPHAGHMIINDESDTFKEAVVSFLKLI